MDFVDATPLASCDAGGNGRTVVMVANQTLPKDVRPLLQGSHRQDLDQYLVQPTKDHWAATSVIKFVTPPQPNLWKISELFTVKLTARDSSGKISRSNWNFIYVKHKTQASEEGRCGWSWQGGKIESHYGCGTGLGGHGYGQTE
jgi:hypothetical protein